MTAQACSTVLIDDRGDLLSLCLPLTIDLSSRRVLQQLGLVVRRRRSQYWRARGRRGGRLLQRRIPTISTRDRSKQINTHIALQASVANIPSPLIRIRKTDGPAPVKVRVFNARAIGNKHAYICDRITTDKLAFCAVVKTWHDTSDYPNRIACVPPGYGFLQRARQRSTRTFASLLTNHGGVCFIRKISEYVISHSLSTTIWK